MLVAHIVEEAFREACSVACTITSSKSRFITDIAQSCSLRCTVPDQVGFFRKLGLEPVHTTKEKVDGVSLKASLQNRQTIQAHSDLQWTNILPEIKADQDENDAPSVFYGICEHCVFRFVE